MKSAAHYEVQAKRENAAPGKDELAEGRRDVLSILNRRKVDGACRVSIIERFPGEAGIPKFLKKRFVNRRPQDTAFHVAPEKRDKRTKSMQCRAAIERVGVEVAGNDCGTLGKRIEDKPHLPCPAVRSSKNFQMRVSYGNYLT